MEDQVLETPDMVVEQVDEQQEPSPTQKMSKREYEIALRRMYKERNEKIKQNKAMVEEMNLEVAYWKAQSDLLKYRFEKMDYYLKNLDIEPKYLAALEEQRQKEDREAGLNPENKMFN